MTGRYVPPPLVEVVVVVVVVVVVLVVVAAAAVVVVVVVVAAAAAAAVSVGVVIVVVIVVVAVVAAVAMVAAVEGGGEAAVTTPGALRAGGQARHPHRLRCWRAALQCHILARSRTGAGWVACDAPLCSRSRFRAQPAAGKRDGVVPSVHPFLAMTVLRRLVARRHPSRSCAQVWLPRQRGQCVAGEGAPHTVPELKVRARVRRSGAARACVTRRET